MNVMDIIMEIERDNYPRVEGLDYYMDCIVTINNVRIRADQVSVVQCDLDDFGRCGIQEILEIRRGDWISWAFLDEIETLKVEEFREG